MNEEQIRKIAENAFKTHFSDVELFQVDVRPRLDHDGDPVVEVNIVCDDDYERLMGPGLLRVQSDIVAKSWREVEDDLGFPIVNFIERATFEQRDQTKA